MSIDGTANDDVLNGTNKADTMNGGVGDDILNSGAGDDILYGGDGDDKLHAGSGNDVLEGGVGDDQLNGGGGSDIFVFNFALVPGGTTLEAVIFPGFNPGADGELSGEEFGQQYRAWLQSVGYDGPDVDAIVNAAWNSSNATDPLTKLEGAIVNDNTIESVVFTRSEGTLTRYYEDTIYHEVSSPAQVIGEGYDTIVSFQEAGPNVDQIELRGLAGVSDSALDSLFDLQLVDTNGDGQNDASELVWDGGSILIGGRTDWGTNVLSFLHDDQVLLV